MLIGLPVGKIGQIIENVTVFRVKKVGSVFMNDYTVIVTEG